MKRAFTLILAVCLCLFLAAPASAAADSSPFVGDWRFYSQEGEAPMSHEEILAMAEMGLDMTTALITSFRGDGTMTMSVFGEKVDGTWTDSGDGSGFFTVEGASYPMSVRDGFLRMDMVTAIGVFEPSETSAEDSTAGFPPLLEEFANQLQEEIVVPEQEVIVSPLVGEWRFYSMESDDPSLNVPHDALQQLREEGRDYAGEYTQTFKVDGWFKFCNFYGFEQNNWSDSGDGTVTIFADGKAWDCSLEDGLLVLRSADCVIRYEKIVPVGTTGYYLVVPADYVPGEVTKEEQQDDMVAYYRSPLHAMDFDIYQFAADGRTPAEVAAAEAEQYGADGTDTVEFGGVSFVFYLSDEKYDDVEYRVASFLFAVGDDLGELVFWLDGGEEAAELTERIVSSIFYIEPIPEDIHGLILKKLEGDFFPDRHQVLGEDGELYEGEYFFGFEDLEPGTEVIVSKMGKDWRIELEDPWSMY